MCCRPSSNYQEAVGIPLTSFTQQQCVLSQAKPVPEFPNVILVCSGSFSCSMTGSDR